MSRRLKCFSGKGLSVGARFSKLSQIQTWEVFNELSLFYLDLFFIPLFIKTRGDRDLLTSLRTLGKEDFFTRELDEKVVSKEVRVAIHSAKDLPSALHKDLSLVALTKGVDSRDVLLFNSPLPPFAKIGCSSLRREEGVKQMGADFQIVDIRGTIENRIQKLDEGEIDGLITAEAALMRLQYTHRKRIFLPIQSAPLQGKLAVIARKDDKEMEELFAPIDTRVAPLR